VLDLTRYIGLDMEDKVEEWSTAVCGSWFRDRRGENDWDCMEYDPDEYDSDVLSVDDEGGQKFDEDESDDDEGLSQVCLSDID
jgi:hypothetical protein